MPQPLSSVATADDGTKFVSFTQDELSKRPKLAAKVMRVIGICSFIDQLLTKMMANFLKADFETVTAMLLALSGAEGRRAAMSAAAETALSEDDYHLYKAVLKATKKPHIERNKYAHHLWGNANYIPDGLLLIDPRYAARCDAKFAAEYKAYREALDARRIQSPPRAPMPKPPTHDFFDYTRILVYRETDIDRDVQDALKAAELISDLTFALSDHPVAAETRSKLFAEPLVQRVLEPKSTQNEH